METTMQTDTDVLIVGAGPTGLMLGIELLRRGIACRLIDANDGPAPHSRAVAIQARTLELFAEMGIVDEALAAGVRARGFTYYVAGKRRARLTFRGIESPYPFILALPQTETERLLLTRLSMLGGHVERQTRLTDLTQNNEDAAATLTYGDGTTERVHARYLIGCDGAHSATRHLLGLTFAGNSYADTFWLADVCLDWRRPAGELSVFLGGDTAWLFAIPLDAHGRYRLIGQAGTADPAHEPTLADFQMLMDRLGPHGTRLRDPVWLAAFHLHHRKVARYDYGRVFLAGDAAHIHSPAGGQGMNTGIQDAHNLAWKLALTLRGLATDSLLGTYHAERNAVGEQVLRGSDVMVRLIRARNPVAQRLRDFAFTLLLPRMRVQRLISRTIAEVSIRYAPSIAVAPGTRGVKVRTGTRAPDADLMDAASDTPTRLFRVLSADAGRYTLLLLSGARGTPARNAALMGLAQRVRARYGAVVAPVLIEAGRGTSAGQAWDGPRYHDPEGAMHQRYGAKQPRACLVRPDGYMAWQGSETDADALLTHLHGVFGFTAQRATESGAMRT